MKGDDNRKPSFDAAESETLGMRGNSMRGNRETLQTPTHDVARDGRKGKKPYSRHARFRGVGRPRSTKEAGEQSRPEGVAAEPVEGRG